jgi:secondary thiamine-phosphate synthase enzyme
MRSTVLRVDTRGRRIVDLTAEVRAFAAEAGADGLLQVFVPHATAAVAIIETGAGSEDDLEALLARLLPREEIYAHRHGSPGHGGDHVVPALLAPSVTVPVLAGEPQLGVWQSVVLVDPNPDNDDRTVRLSLLAG